MVIKKNLRAGRFFPWSYHLENQLKYEQSIYLLRHSQNPVSWQTWNDETFALAKEINKPIFLSCGYSSCHWCRVMEKESFEDEETAKIINENFIPVKVDKDELPDIDKEYQFYLQSTGEAGGWPLTVFMTPDKEPFFAGTYFKNSEFKKMLSDIAELYNDKPDEIEKVIKTRKEFLEKFNMVVEPPELTEQELEEYRKGEFKKIFDDEFGGFRNGAKFPYIPAMLYLADNAQDEEISAFLIKTTDQLCSKAISDHLYGGFFRYTIDRQWKQPHFEKMLTDNALIPIFLLKMYDLTANNTYLLTAKKAVDFILHNLMTDYGVLNSIDADSPNADGLLSEGYFYKVTDRDFSTLAEGELKTFPTEAGVENGIIWLKNSSYIKVAAMQPTLEKIAKRTASVKIAPKSDNKVISGSNFLFVTAILECFETSGDDWYLNQGTALYQKIRYLLVDDDARVFRACYGDSILTHRVLEDSVNYLQATLKLFDITHEREVISTAQKIIEDIEHTFVKDGIPYLDTNHRIADTFDDDRLNPIGLYLYLLKKYENTTGKSADVRFLRYANDRAMRFPTGHPTILRALD